MASKEAIGAGNEHGGSIIHVYALKIREHRRDGPTISQTTTLSGNRGPEVKTLHCDMQMKSQATVSSVRRR